MCNDCRFRSGEELEDARGPLEHRSVEPKRGVSKPTAYVFQNCPSIVVNKLRTTVPSKQAHFYIRDI